MSTQTLNDAAWIKYPFTYRNDRGCAYRKGKPIYYGIPEPKRGKGKEPESAMKGGDRIGFKTIKVTPDMVGKNIAVFVNVEIKGPGDKAKEGQVRWHNFILQHGGISEIWKEDGEIISCETTKKEVNR